MARDLHNPINHSRPLGVAPLDGREPQDDAGRASCFEGRPIMPEQVDVTSVQNALKGLNNAKDNRDCTMRQIKVESGSYFFGQWFKKDEPEFVAVAALVQARVDKEFAAAEKAFRDACKAVEATKAA
jgi:hypothetical protein